MNSKPNLAEISNMDPYEAIAACLRYALVTTGSTQRQCIAIAWEKASALQKSHQHLGGQLIDTINEVTRLRSEVYALQNHERLHQMDPT